MSRTIYAVIGKGDIENTHTLSLFVCCSLSLTTHFPQLLLPFIMQTFWKYLEIQMVSLHHPNILSWAIS